MAIPILQCAANIRENPLAPGSFVTWESALAHLESRHGPSSDCWTYEDALGVPRGLIVEWDAPDGREIREISRLPSKNWAIASLPVPRPLYDLSCLRDAEPGQRVYVVTREALAQDAKEMDLLATTNPHGVAGVEKTDWRPLAGREAVILPDNTESSRRYAQAVVRILSALDPPARVRILELPGLPPDGTLLDWIDAHPLPIDGRDLHKEIEALADAAPVRSSPVPTDGPVLQCFADICSTPVRWLWPARVPLGRITLLVGRPGEGKSFLTTDLAARVSRGRPWPDGSEGEAGSVLFISAEDDPGDTLRPRLEAHGADVTKIHWLAMVRRRGPDGIPYEIPFTLADAESLEQSLQTCPDCRLVVVDPIGSFLDRGTDSYRDPDVRALLDPVARLAERYGPAVLVVAHRRKNSGSSHADDLALGSRAFTGVARAVWHLTRDTHDKKRRLLLPGKNNLADEGRGLAFRITGEPPALVWENELVDLTANEALVDENAATPTNDRAAAKSQAVEWLRELLAHGPVSAVDVNRQAKEAGYSWRVLAYAKDQLGVRPNRVNGTGPWIWRLPAEAPETAQAARQPA